MLSRKIVQTLSEKARDDLEDILQYTLDNWGEAQEKKYAALLDEAITTIVEHKEFGVKYQSPVGECRLFYAGSHVIVYRACGRHVQILRILHKRMDIRKRLQ